MKIKSVGKLIICASIIASFLLLFGCFIPEKFKVTCEIDKKGTYSFRYEGTVVFAPVLGREEKLTPKDEKEIEELGKGMLSKEPTISNFSYEGQGRFKIVDSEEGKTRGTVGFFEFRVIDDNILELRAVKIKESYITELKKVEFRPDGVFQLTTNAKVLKHNATDEPGLFSKSYKWEIKDLKSDLPYIQLEMEKGALGPSAIDVTTKFIKAIQNSDYEGIFSMKKDYNDQIESIKEKNPKVLWEKLLSDFRNKSLKELKEGAKKAGNKKILRIDPWTVLMSPDGNPKVPLSDLFIYFTPTCQWSLVETRRQVNQFDKSEGVIISYIAITCPRPSETIYLKGKPLKKTIIGLTFDAASGLFETATIVEKAIEWWEVEIPRPQGAVNDFANVLEERQLRI